MCAEKKKITLSCEVDTYRSGWTVVQFLSHRFKYHTPERWTQRVLDDFVRVNGADVSPEHIVKKDDTITYTFFHAEPDVDFKYDIVFEDDYLFAVSKSGNIPVHACGVYISNTLIGTLKNIHGDHLNLAHRLDRETSGLVLLSKDPKTARVMGRMFAEAEVTKRYIAVVHGRVEQPVIDIDAPIGKTIEEITNRPDEEIDGDLAVDLPRYVPRRRVDFKNGKQAATRCEVEERIGEFTLVRAYPVSGRTNQIRVHMDHIGHPIVGDKVYRFAGGTPDGELITRHALHCVGLEFAHPVTGRPVELAAPPPEDIEKLIESLRTKSKVTGRTAPDGNQVY
jgi:RluA family pseudouridine synthase